MSEGIICDKCSSDECGVPETWTTSEMDLRTRTESVDDKRDEPDDENGICKPPERTILEKSLRWRGLHEGNDLAVRPEARWGSTGQGVGRKEKVVL